MTPKQRAQEFCEGAFGPFGVNVEPYTEIVAELIEGAEADATRPLAEALREARVQIAASRDSCKELIPIAADLGKPRWPVDGRIAVLDALLSRIDAALSSTESKS